MLHLGNWELLFLVLDEGSIARAADERGLERTRLSRLIAALEKETGVELVERIGRRLMPTQAALEIRPKVEPLIASLHKSLEDLRRGRSMESGSIRFGAMPGFLQTQVVPLLAEFQQAYPGVSFDVIGDDDPSAFMRGQTDLMLYYGPVNQPRLVEHWVTHSTFVPCASPLYLKEHGTPLAPDDLSRHAGILYTGKVRPHSQVLEFAGQQKSFGWKSQISFNNILLAKTACLEGCGILLDLPLHRLPHISKRMAIAALNDTEYYDRVTAELLATREDFSAQLNALPGILAYESDANFVYIKLVSYDVERIKAVVEKEGYLIRIFTGNEEKHLRITIGTKALMDKFTPLLVKTIQESKI